MTSSTSCTTCKIPKRFSLLHVLLTSGLMSGSLAFPVLPTEVVEALEIPISGEELLEAITAKKLGKASGPDGLSLSYSTTINLLFALFKGT